METNNSVDVLQQEIDMLYRKYNINVCVGCKFEHTASCDMAVRLPHCQQQLMKYYNDKTTTNNYERKTQKRN